MLPFKRKKKKNVPYQIPKLTTYTYPNSVVSEQFRTIRSNLQFSIHGNTLKTLGITSSGPGEGKSTIAANLATVLADQNKRILLVDADLRRPSIHRIFHKSNTIGLTTLIQHSEADLESAIHRCAVKNLYILTSGPISERPSELLSSENMTRLIRKLQANFDLIIFDLPPAVAVTDAQIMATKVDGTILVVRNNVAYKEAVGKAVDLLNMVGANVIGTIFNGAERKTTEPYAYYGK